MIQEQLPELIGTLKQLTDRVGHGTVAGNLERLAEVALAYYREVVPMVSSLFAEPHLLARHQHALRERGLGPHLAVAALADYLDAEQQLGRVSATTNPRATAALVLGACFQRAFFATFAGPHSLSEDDRRFAAEIVAPVTQGFPA